MGQRIKTNPCLLTDLIKRMTKKGCDECGAKIPPAGLGYVEQLPNEHWIVYRVLCDDCGRAE